MRRASRGGPVWEHPEPVATVYERPEERVLFWSARDANPFFHFFECLHMLAGRNDVAWLAQFNARISQYSDDGVTFHAPYGHRWRKAFELDQLERVIALLRHDPDTRRAVIQMWHAPLDLVDVGVKRADLPCNVIACFKIRDGRLLMTVCCRSNDIVWGAYGANAVHFSSLQEFIAGRVGVPMGAYTQVSDSFHAYEGVWEGLHGLPADQLSPYETGEVCAYPFGAVDQGWDEDLHRFMAAPLESEYLNSFFRVVAVPLWKAFWHYKSGEFDAALGALGRCGASDWAKAAAEWIRRRQSYRRAIGART